MFSKQRIALCLFGAALLAPLFCMAFCDAGAASGKKSPADLIGKSREEVIAVLGYPAGAGAGSNSYQLDYHLDGTGHRLWFYDHVLAFVESCESPALSGTRDFGIQPGQGIRTLIQKMGPPLRISTGSVADEFHYGGGKRVTVAHGIAIGVNQDK